MPGFEIIDNKEKKAVNKLFNESSILMAHGFENIRKYFHVRSFEKNFSKKIKSKYSLAVSSGTAAIKIALKAINIKPGDEVITQSFNFIATVEAIIDIGAVPVVINIDKSLNMDPNLIENAITKKTKAILPVHMLGYSCQMDKILKIAKKYNLFVIEDNCEALGGKYKKKLLGNIGDIGTYSLDFGKIITTGEGGLITTNKKNFDKSCREYHDHGHENNPNYPRGRDTKTKPGFNYRMTEIQGTIGNIQLKKLGFIIKENKKRFQAFDKNLSKKFIRRYLVKNSIPSYDCHIIFIKDEALRNKIISIYKKDGFGIKNLPDAIEWHCSYYWDHIFSKKNLKKFVFTNNLLKTAVALPISLKISHFKYIKLAKKLNKI